MNKGSPSILLLACLSLVLFVVVGCYPPATAVPPTTPANPITNIVWQWTSVTNQTARETTEVPSP